MSLLSAHAYQRFGEMAASAGRHLVVALLQISGEKAKHAVLSMGLAAAAAIALVFARGLHSFQALGTDASRHLHNICQMQNVDLFQI